MSPQQTEGSEKSNISSFEFAREAEGFSSTPRPMGRAQHYRLGRTNIVCGRTSIVQYWELAWHTYFCFDREEFWTFFSHVLIGHFWNDHWEMGTRQVKRPRIRHLPRCHLSLSVEYRHYVMYAVYLYVFIFPRIG
jgi:hypothetical protein